MIILINSSAVLRRVNEKSKVMCIRGRKLLWGQNRAGFVALNDINWTSSSV